MKFSNFIKSWTAVFPLFVLAAVSVVNVALASQITVSIPNAGFEDNSFDGWNKGLQTGNLGASINGNGTGVTIFNGSRTFSHGPHGSVGSPTKPDGSPNPYYAPAVPAGSWTFGPNNATYAAALQPKGEQNFAQAMAELGLSGSSQTEIEAQLLADRNASGFGSPNPTDAAWITREVQLTAGVTYTMSWNYVGTDYVPFNDGSITSLVKVSAPSTPEIIVNNFNKPYALLGFTNPGTGDYSTNSYGSTGWQTSTYQVSVTGTYKLGFAVFNLGDTALSPVLMIDNATGTTNKCAQNGSGCVSFGGVEPNNETAPTVAPTTTTVVETTTTVDSTTTTVENSTTTTEVVPETSTTSTIQETTTTAAPLPPPAPPAPSTPVEPPPAIIPDEPVDDEQPELVVEEEPVTEATNNIENDFQEEIEQDTIEEDTTSPTSELDEEETPLTENTTPEVEVDTDDEATEDEVFEAVVSAELLIVLSFEEASEIFNSLDTSSLTQEQKIEIIAAVQNAPDEVREAFEEEVNIYTEGFDQYIPLGSSIDVGTRRSLLAVTAATATLAVGATIAASGTRSSPSSSNNQIQPPRAETVARREEGEDEAAGELTELEHEDDERFTRNSIFNYYTIGGVEMKKFDIWGFLKKLWDITGALAFTLAGSVIVFITLSGETRKMAMIATAAALIVHYIYTILKNDE